MSIDIFNEVKETVMPQWAKFVNPEDKAQGTYVGKIVGVKDSYGNEQIVYQLLQEDGNILNVGFGLNKKFINRDMESVKFGQIIGFRYKGIVVVKDKRTGKDVSVKDYALHQDPKIVNAVWLKENMGNMPEVTRAEATAEVSSNDLAQINAEVKAFDGAEDLPFSSPGSLTNEDKLAVIMKLAKDKLGATDLQSVKDKVMGTTGLAFIPLQYDKITETLSAM